MGKIISIEVKQASKILQALNYDARLYLFMFLKENGETSVSDLCNHFEQSPSTMSSQLKVLSDANLLVQRREGRFIYYSARMDFLDHLAKTVQKLRSELTS